MSDVKVVTASVALEGSGYTTQALAGNQKGMSYKTIPEFGEPELYHGNNDFPFGFQGRIRGGAWVNFNNADSDFLQNTDFFGQLLVGYNRHSAAVDNRQLDFQNKMDSSEEREYLQFRMSGLSLGASIGGQWRFIGKDNTAGVGIRANIERVYTDINNDNQELIVSGLDMTADLDDYISSKVWRGSVDVTFTPNDKGLYLFAGVGKEWWSDSRGMQQNHGGNMLQADVLPVDLKPLAGMYTYAGVGWDIGHAISKHKNK